jgi:hypothetical protein
MTLRSATHSLGLFLAPFLVLSGFANAAPAGECHHCPKTYFCRPKPPCIKYRCVCPRPIGCGGVEHFGYYPTCWTAWPFPPDYSYCPSPPIVAAAPSAPANPAPSQEQLPPPKTVPKPSQPSLQ